jgi:putative transposase
MCTWLSVSASGFFDWRQRPDSATARRRERLSALIREAFEASDETYGYRRIHAQLARWGVPCGPELVRGIMRELGLRPCQPRPWRASLTEQDGGAHHLPDLVARDFTAARPGQKFVGSGGRRESHPPAPTEPCVTVSRHTALTIQSARILSSTSNARTVGSHAR